jgi:hypothetical protein
LLRTGEGAKEPTRGVAEVSTKYEVRSTKGDRIVESGKSKVERFPSVPFWAAAFFTAFVLLLPGGAQAITAQEIMECGVGNPVSPK